MTLSPYFGAVFRFENTQQLKQLWQPRRKQGIPMLALAESNPAPESGETTFRIAALQDYGHPSLRPSNRGYLLTATDVPKAKELFDKATCFERMADRLLEGRETLATRLFNEEQQTIEDALTIPNFNAPENRPASHRLPREAIYTVLAVVSEQFAIQAQQAWKDLLHLINSARIQQPPHV